MTKEDVEDVEDAEEEDKSSWEMVSWDVLPNNDVDTKYKEEQGVVKDIHSMQTIKKYYPLQSKQNIVSITPPLHCHN
jgi:hypothetical protein